MGSSYAMATPYPPMMSIDDRPKATRFPKPFPVPNQPRQKTGTSPRAIAPTVFHRRDGRQATVITNATAIPMPRLSFSKEKMLRTPPDRSRSRAEVDRRPAY